MLSEPENAALASWITGNSSVQHRITRSCLMRARRMVQFPWSGRCHHRYQVRLTLFPVIYSCLMRSLSSFGCATFLSTLCTFRTGFVPNEKTQIGVYAAVLFSQGLINTFGVGTLHYLNNISVWWHALGTTAVGIAVVAAAPTHQSPEFVFQTLIDNTGGWSERASPAYVVVVGVSAFILSVSSLDADRAHRF